MNVVQFAEEILTLSEERDYYRRQMLHYKGMFEDQMRSQRETLEFHESMMGDILVAALDPDSGINRAQRAMARDPLRGAAEETK